ncbi:suppressor of fused domain protein [Paenibacillus terreus]|uniref:Suppressor of fused domain protein n=1 Tax=Paenibacillus terreus TaxID=1387834 RepID=A0ABV5B6V2_9BACL
MSEELNAPGWDAIDQTLRNIYGDQEPKHYGTLIPYALGGQDPLQGISAYMAETPQPHWHFVTYGFSALYEKESENADYSGYGFELTFRLPRQPEEEEPPAWALNLLQNIGRYVFGSGNTFQAGDYMDANGPICLDADTRITALAFTADPELPEIDTPNGRLEFLQMIGITADELQAMQTWNTLGVLSVCEPYMPRYITDLNRDSFLRHDAVSGAIRLGHERDGSSTGFLYVDQLTWEPGKKGLFKKSSSTLTLGAKQAGIIGSLLRGRILKGKKLSLSGPSIRVVFEPGESPAWETQEGEVRIMLNGPVVDELASKLIPQAGVFEVSFLTGVLFQIVKTEIKDHEGQVVEIIG